MKHTNVVSSTPGRTRFRVPPKRRNYQEMERIASGIQANPDVDDVQFNVQTGSILVHHKSHHGSFQNICDTLRDLGCVFGDVTGTSELLPLNGKSAENKLDFDTAISDLNKRVRQATNGMVDLRFVLPLAFSALAVVQFLTYGLQFELVPWFVLAYFAVESFIRLNFNQAPATQSS